MSTGAFGEVLGMYFRYCWRAREKGVGLGCRLSGTKQKSHLYKGKQERFKKEQKARNWVLLSMNVSESSSTLREEAGGDEPVTGH